MSDQQLPVPPLRIPFESLPSKFGGYERGATRKLVEEIAAAYEAVWLQCAELRETEARLRAELAQGNGFSRPTIVDGSGSAAEIVEEARREAQLALKKARKRAEKTARRVEREARVKADKIISDAHREIEQREAELPTAAALADPKGSAGEIVDQARREAQLVLKKAHSRAERIVGEARRDRQEIELEIDRLATIANETRDDLSSFLLAAAKWYRDSRDGKTSAPEVGAFDGTTAPSRERSGLDRIASLLEAVERRRGLEARQEIEESMDDSG